MRLNPLAFNGLLSGNLAQRARWRSATLCPCVNPDSGSAAPGCPRCSGRGRVWAAPIECLVGVASTKDAAKYAQAFNMDTGDILLVVDESCPAYVAGLFDRVTMLNSTDRFSLALTRGSPQERIFGDVVSVDRVYWYTGDAGQGDVVDGGRPLIGADGVLAWGVGAPPPGKSYSITGTKYEEYFSYLDYPTQRGQHQGARLPRRMPVRRFDVFGR